MTSENAPIDYTFIDPNIRGFIKLLNSLPGIRTMGCCGGHKNPGPTQHAFGEWFVTFWVYKSGYNSLQVIEKLCKNVSTLELDGPFLNGYKAKRGWYSLSGRGKPETTEKKLQALI